MVNKNELILIMDLKLAYQDEIDKMIRNNIAYGKTQTKIVNLDDRPIFDFNTYELKSIFEPYKKEGYVITYNKDEVIIDWEP